MTHWWQDYEPAPVEESLAEALRILARLDAPDLNQLPHAENGACDDDCGRHGVRYVVGRFAVCRVCAARRLRALERAA